MSHVANKFFNEMKPIITGTCKDQQTKYRINIVLHGMSINLVTYLIHNNLNEKQPVDIIVDGQLNSTASFCITYI